MDTGRYWFPAKRYGWGWGLPITWQGWVVALLWFAVMVAGVPLIGPRHHPIAFYAFVLGMIAVLSVICYAKGEPPRWQWGERK